jgi:hypothetical protein
MMLVEHKLNYFEEGRHGLGVVRAPSEVNRPETTDKEDLTLTLPCSA